MVHHSEEARDLARAGDPEQVGNLARAEDPEQVGDLGLVHHPEEAECSALALELLEDQLVVAELLMVLYQLKQP